VLDEAITLDRHWTRNNDSWLTIGIATTNALSSRDANWGLHHVRKAPNRR
jgi:hypothetical protein